MKKILLLITLISFVNCQKKQINADLYINGEPYYVKTYCVEEKKITEFKYHYGYSFIRGKFCWHWGNKTTYECVKERTDTIKII